MSLPFEGSTSQANVEMRPEVYKGFYSDVEWRDLARYRQAERRYTFVNCWKLAERESAALWGLYVPPNGGVAIRSTFRRLQECFGPLDPQPQDGIRSNASTSGKCNTSTTRATGSLKETVSTHMYTSA